MSKKTSGTQVKDLGSLLTNGEGWAVGLAANGVLRLSEKEIAQAPILLDKVNGLILTPQGVQVTVVYRIGSAMIDVEGLRDAAWQALVYLLNHPNKSVRKANEQLMHEAERLHSLLLPGEFSVVSRICGRAEEIQDGFTIAGESADMMLLERVLFFSVMNLMEKAKEGNGHQVIFVIRNWWISAEISNPGYSVEEFIDLASSWLGVSPSFVEQILHMFNAVA